VYNDQMCKTANLQRHWCTWRGHVSRRCNAQTTWTRLTANNLTLAWRLVSSCVASKTLHCRPTSSHRPDSAQWHSSAASMSGNIQMRLQCLATYKYVTVALSWTFAATKSVDKQTATWSSTHLPVTFRSQYTVFYTLMSLRHKETTQLITYVPRLFPSQWQLFWHNHVNGHFPSLPRLASHLNG